MKLSRVAQETSLPEWLLPTIDTAEEKTDEALVRLNLSKADEVDDGVLAQECDCIEQCAASKQPYYVNAEWRNKDKEHLHEFAMVCGLSRDLFREGTETQIQSNASNEEDEELVKLAASATAPKDTLDIGDPFKLDQLGEMDHMNPTNWEDVKKSEILDDKPVLAQGNIVPIRGGDEYEKHPVHVPPMGQNSIVNPDAIEQAANSDELDTGVRLRNEKAQKEAAKKQAHVDWQDDLVGRMKKLDIVPKGSVFPTEMLHAQSGLNTPSSSEMGVYAQHDPNDIPDKTPGEQLKDKATAHREAIQRPKQDNDWERPSREASRSISETFADALKDALGKQK